MKKIHARSMLSLCAVFGIFLAVPVFADTIKADPINLSIGIGGVRQVSDLPQYLGVIYKWFVGAAMVIAAFMITLGGFQYVASAGIPKYVGMAKSRMVNGLMGLILVIGSYVLLNSINPAFTQLQLPAIRKIEKIELPAKSCLDYADQATCQSDPGGFGKDTKGCRWEAGVCFTANPSTGINGGPCAAKEPFCGTGMLCVDSLSFEGFKIPVCTDGKNGSPCRTHASDPGASGCLQSAAFPYVCDDATSRCILKDKKKIDDRCLANGDCASNICVKGVCTDPSQKDVYCGSGTSCPDGFWCCSDEKILKKDCQADVKNVCQKLRIGGVACETPDVCASKACSYDARGCFGVEGNVCGEDNECASGKCDTGACTAKK